MTISEDSISLADAMADVRMTHGAAGTLLQYLAQQIGTDTEAGAALRDAGAALTYTPITRATTKSSTSA
jgi:hypothetical protein